MTYETDLMKRKEISSIQNYWIPGAKAETRTCIDTALTKPYILPPFPIKLLSVWPHMTIIITYITSKESV